jgi:branched-chain amino acid transport system permease protein
MFVSPVMLSWTTSGETLVTVILGGIGTLAGPAVGATLVVFLQHALSDLTRYWQLVLGVILIGVVLLGNRGVYGQIEHLISRYTTARKTRPTAETLIQHAEPESPHA